jgi:uncharacterized membrane protein
VDRSCQEHRVVAEASHYGGNVTWSAEESSGLVPAGAFAEVAEAVARVIEAVGIGILVVGGLLAAVEAVRNALARRPVYQRARRSFGRVLLLALEVLVAADVVQTVAVDLTLESVATLGLLVIVRTVLSFSLSAELEGIAPWRRAEFEARNAQEAASEAAPSDPATPPRSTARRAEL